MRAFKRLRLTRPRLGAALAVGGLLATGALLAGCGGQTYSCGTGAANHCYGTVSWKGAATGLSMELTPVPLTSGDIFIDDEAWLVDYFASGSNTIDTAYWVETGEWNDGFGTDYFWAENKPLYGFMNYDVGPVQLPNNDWIAYKIEQASPSSWNVTISDANTGTVIHSAQSTSNPMTPNTIIEGEELAGSQNASNFAFFSQNAAINNGVTTLHTTDGTVRMDDPPRAGWFGANNAPSQSTTGGLFFTECCNK